MAEYTPSGRLLPRQDGYTPENEGQAASFEGGELQGFRRGPDGKQEEKEGQFESDGTKLMPELRAIHKLGDYSTYGVEDMVADNQSFWNKPTRDIKEESDVRTSGSGEGTGTPTDTPIEDEDQSTNEKNSTGYLENRVGKLKKRAHVLQGHTTVQGIPIAIENKPGSIRKGVDEDGHEWKTEMHNSYGYIVGTKGADGEEVDAYVGPDKGSDTAYVVHQKDPKTGKYDEDKCMLSYGSKKEAKEAFLKHYDDPSYLGPISEVPMDRLKELVASKRRLVKIATAGMRKLTKLVVLLLCIALPRIALADECTTQSYSDPKKEPNWECPAPNESALVPTLQFRPSAALEKDAKSPFSGILMDQNLVLSLGLRIKAVRRLLWIEMQINKDQAQVEKKYTEMSHKAETDLLTSQRDNYKVQVSQIQTDLEAERKWYRSWSFGVVLGIVVTAAAGTALAVGMH